MSKLPEPWRVKMIERVRLPSRDEREALVRAGAFNLFRVPSEHVFIDLFTDSGTSAMSDAQWGALIQGDEAYAGARGYHRLERTVQEITGLPHMIPTHQGRAAENLLFSTLIKPGAIVPNNTHFDTTRAHIEVNGGTPLDLVIAESRQPSLQHPFKGNIDLERLAALFRSTPRSQIPLAMLTLTNNAGGGQPVALANIRGMAELCREHEIPFFLDASRFAENAWFIKQREPGQQDRSVAEIAREIFGYVDGCTMSAKKDGLVNIGGFVACRDGELAEMLRARLILFEGFPTYGGMAGRDLDALAVGLHEVLDEDYLRFRIGQVATFAEQIEALGIPTIRPAGGHAVYVDAGAFLPHIPPLQFPGHALTLALYREGGIRASDIGSVGFSRRDPGTGEWIPAPLELMRLAVPRRVYTASHLEYVIDVLRAVCDRADGIKGFRIVRSAPVLRQFTADFEELT